MSKDTFPPTYRFGRDWFWLVSILCALTLQAIHIAYCELSVMAHFQDVLVNNDSHANLRWAASILDQGWINANPYHPYNDWMLSIAPFEQWEQWWGGGQVFQQAPLYAYVLAFFGLFGDDLIYVRLFQGILGVWLCVLIAQVTEQISGKTMAAKVAFSISVLYAPFYVYSWELLRDILSWTLTAAMLLVWLRLAKSASEVEIGAKVPRCLLCMGFGFGVLLGVGYLSRETYLLVIPAAAGTIGWILLRRKQPLVLVALLAGLFVALLPLAARNYIVHAPLLSSSNRLAETFIEGHSNSARPYFFVIPKEMKSIMEETEGATIPVILAAIKSHPTILSWLALQWSKLLSLADPYEPCDNINIYFVEQISPIVRWGLKHWMILVPGLGGLLLSILRRDTRHWPLWVLLPILLANVMIGVPLSRYRQFLMLLWIPWAAYFVVALFEHAKKRELREIIGMSFVLLVGWILSLGPLSRCPKKFYLRPLEYTAAAIIYDRLNQEEDAQNARRMVELLNRAK